PVHQLRRILRPGGERVEDRVSRQPRRKGERIQELRRGAAGGLRFLPRALSQDRSVAAQGFWVITVFNDKNSISTNRISVEPSSYTGNFLSIGAAYGLLACANNLPGAPRS